jgi:hypothetical protein
VKKNCAVAGPVRGVLKTAAVLSGTLYSRPAPARPNELATLKMQT